MYLGLVYWFVCLFVPTSYQPLVYISLLQSVCRCYFSRSVHFYSVLPSINDQGGQEVMRWM